MTTDTNEFINGRLVTVRLDGYYVTSSNGVVTSGYGAHRCVEITGEVERFPHSKIVRLRQSEGRYALFHVDDAEVI